MWSHGKSYEMSNEDVSLTLGPVGPRGPCGPLTPMAPWGKRQKVSNKRLHHISIWHKEYLCMCVLLCSLVCLCSISLSLLTLQSVVRYKYIVFNWIKLWLCNDGNRPLLHLRLFFTSARMTNTQTVLSLASGTVSYCLLSAYAGTIWCCVV